MAVLTVAVTVRGYILGSVLVLLIAAAIYLVRRYWPWRRASVAPPETRPDIEEPPAERHVRSASDVVRLIVGVCSRSSGWCSQPGPPTRWSASSAT